MSVIRIPLAGRSNARVNTTVFIDEVYDITLGDEISFKDGSVATVRSIGPCPYYGYEHYPAAYIVEESGAWSDYIVLDLYPDTTLAAYDSIYTSWLGWELVEPVLVPFDNAMTDGLLERRSAVGQAAS